MKFSDNFFAETVRDVEVGSSSLLIPTIKRLNIYLVDI